MALLCFFYDGPLFPFLIFDNLEIWRRSFGQLRPECSPWQKNALIENQVLWLGYLIPRGCFCCWRFSSCNSELFFSNPGRMPFVKSAKSNCTTEHADKKEPTRQRRANTQFEEKSSQGNFCKHNHKATIRTDLRELANCSSKQHLAINAFVPRQKKRGFSTSRIFKDCICTRRESQSGA